MGIRFDKEKGKIHRTHNVLLPFYSFRRYRTIGFIIIVNNSLIAKSIKINISSRPNQYCDESTLCFSIFFSDTEKYFYKL